MFQVSKQPGWVCQNMDTPYGHFALDLQNGSAKYGLPGLYGLRIKSTFHL